LRYSIEKVYIFPMIRYDTIYRYQKKYIDIFESSLTDNRLHRHPLAWTFACTDIRSYGQVPIWTMACYRRGGRGIGQKPVTRCLRSVLWT